MNDLPNESLVALTDAASSLPRRPHVSTLHRWRTRGVRGVRLEALLVGGKWCTSPAALRRFFVETTVAANRSAGNLMADDHRDATSGDGDECVAARLDAAGI